MNVIEEPNSLLRVESLKGHHIPMLRSLKPNKGLGYLQLMLLRNWLASLEKNLSRFLPSRNSFCYLALEDKKPVALILLKPYNLQGTCWTIPLVEVLSTQIIYSEKKILQCLIKTALEYGNVKTHSWLIESSITDNNRLAIAREFGFQPLKIFNCWSPTDNSKYEVKEDKLLGLSSCDEWQEVNNINANSLLRLQQLWESSHLRQITDRNYKDILEKKHNCTKVLVSKVNSSNAHAGLIVREFSENDIYIELIRDASWNEKISINIQFALSKLVETNKGISIYIQTSKEDEKLTELLKTFGWKLTHEKLLLGRSLWRRQESKKLSIRTNNLESMLGSLSPQTPPLPTPTLVPR